MRTGWNKKLRGQTRGDTIVEVLIAVAIVSLILVIAYATTSRSTQSLQDTQEHREATALAQSQVEFIHGNGGLDASAKGCFDQSGVPVDRSPTNCRFGAEGSVSGCTDGAVTDPIN